MPDYPVRLKKYPGREYGWFAEVTSLPYCTSNGRTKAEVLRNIREAIQCHLEGLAKGIPRKPGSRATPQGFGPGAGL